MAFVCVSLLKLRQKTQKLRKFMMSSLLPPSYFVSELNFRITAEEQSLASRLLVLYTVVACFILKQCLYFCRQIHE